jgi:hypothetical protein
MLACQAQLNMIDDISDHATSCGVDDSFLSNVLVRMLSHWNLLLGAQSPRLSSTPDAAEGRDSLAA